MKGDLYLDGQLIMTDVEVSINTRTESGLRTWYGAIRLNAEHTLLGENYEIVCDGQRYRVSLSGNIASRPGDVATFVALGAPTSE